MNIQSVTRRVLLPLLAVVMGLSSVQAREINLTTSLATPVMSADQRQNTFIKISLEGFKQEHSEKRIPANIAIVLDKSGSMQGEKIQQAREAAVMAIQRLNENDIVSVVSYDSRVQVVVPATRVSDKHQIARAIRNIHANGNTALFAGVSKGAQELRKFLDLNNVNRVILLSDGLANVGPSTPNELGQLGLSLAKEGMSVTTIGLGLGYNEDLMTQLAGYSDGNHAFVENAEDLARIFQYEFGDVLSVVAQGVNIEIHCKNGVRPVRILGREAEIRGNRITTRMNQLYSEQEKFIILEVEIPAQSEAQNLEVADVGVSYTNLYSKQAQSLRNRVLASFSQSEKQIQEAVDVETYEAAAEQVANEESRRAIKLRDQGDIEAAKSVLKQNAIYLDNLGQSLASPKLLEQKAEALQDAEELESEQGWNRKRKELKERQYKRATQQSY
ncbi:VWA domain-containing protein [Pontibacterium granulatum]|uniref:vWA domain-containing protein n=1 Tax=Pontibacterium granulatum TaxID=2036029 RepID=UPI00249B86D2|nr:VWA domain-containing protein [Pontibacterium granulatum]MDI3324132.1 VWA domain-containing protein [Pontibacterium granulatum]